jgi:hypothetical protein
VPAASRKQGGTVSRDPAPRLAKHRISPSPSDGATTAAPVPRRTGNRSREGVQPRPRFEPTTMAGLAYRSPSPVRRTVLDAVRPMSPPSIMVVHGYGLFHRERVHGATRQGTRMPICAHSLTEDGNAPGSFAVAPFHQAWDSAQRSDGELMGEEGMSGVGLIEGRIGRNGRGCEWASVW